MARFVQRTWQKTSERICLANQIPPGFRIVLLDEHGRVKRGDLFVRSGGFSVYPASFRIWAFLEEAIKDVVKDAAGLNYADAELRDHRNMSVNPDLTLQNVRDMPGAGGKHTQTWYEDYDIICGLETEIEDALAIFDEEDYRLASDRDNFAKCLLLKALISYIISRFDIYELDYVLDFYETDIKRKRQSPEIE